MELHDAKKVLTLLEFKVNNFVSRLSAQTWQKLGKTHDANKVHKLLKFKACELNQNQKNGKAMVTLTEHLNMEKNLDKRSMELHDTNKVYTLLFKVNKF